MLIKVEAQNQPQILCYPAPIDQAEALMSVLTMLPQLSLLESQCREFREQSLSALPSIGPLLKFLREQDPQADDS